LDTLSPPIAADREGPDDALTPLDPAYVKLLRIVTALWALPFVVGAGVLGTALPLPPGLLLGLAILLAGAVIFRVPFRRYHARGYHMGADQLRVVRGLLFRSDTVVPFGRVQHIDVDQGPLERRYDLATLVLHTAGTHNASVPLPGLPVEQARAMRETIRARIRRDTM
jgi:membrane protein YdbS with pleckstrin-like domain